MVRCREPISYSALRARAFGREKQGKGEGGKGRWPLQIVEAAKSIWGLWPSTVLKGIMLRRWLYLSGRDLYSRPLVKLYLRTGSSAYSRPRAESGGAQRSLFDVKNPVERALSA